MNNIIFEINEPPTTDEFVAVLKTSGLSERRPIHDKKCMEGMVNNSNLIICARDNLKLIGIARSVTDFNYCCYLSDIAVDKRYQKQGVGRKLLELTREQLGPHCKLILLSAPAATQYYPKLGFKKHPEAWVHQG